MQQGYGKVAHVAELHTGERGTPLEPFELMEAARLRVQSLLLGMKESFMPLANGCGSNTGFSRRTTLVIGPAIKRMRRNTVVLLVVTQYVRQSNVFGCDFGFECTVLSWYVQLPTEGNLSVPSTTKRKEQSR